MPASKRIARSLAPLLLLVGACVAAGQSVDRLSWLAGCWSIERGEPGSGEQWMAPAGGTLLGTSRTVRDGRTAGFEFMRIASGADGTLAFHAQPSGKPGASFALTSLTDTSVVFENPRTEFPQRIVYRLEAPGRLGAAIEGTRDGIARRIDYPMLRTTCPAASSPGN